MVVLRVMTHCCLGRYMGRLMAPVTAETAALEAGGDDDNASDDDVEVGKDGSSTEEEEEVDAKVGSVPPQGETQADPEALMKARKAFKAHVKGLIAKLSEYVDEDDAADQTAVIRHRSLECLERLLLG